MNTQTELISFPEGILLKSGDRLDTFDLMVETYGELNDLKTNAVLVCGQPQQLLQLFQNTLPPNVFQMLVENLNGLPTGMKEVSEKYLCKRLI